MREGRLSSHEPQGKVPETTVQKQSPNPENVQKMCYLGGNCMISYFFTTLSCKDIGIRKSEFVAKTQFLYKDFLF